MASWIHEGTAWRTPPQPFPVVHLLVTETEQLWCSGGKGRIDNPLRMDGERVCHKCKRLALEAIEDGTLTQADAPRFVGG